MTLQYWKIFAVHQILITVKLIEYALQNSCLNGIFNINSIQDPVNERGGNLSGGIKQRIAIAKTIYNYKSMLVLDESTNALDEMTELKIIKFLLRKNSKQTVLSITHRLNTIFYYDAIFLVSDGSVTICRDKSMFADLIDKHNVALFKLFIIINQIISLF